MTNLYSVSQILSSATLPLEKKKKQKQTNEQKNRSFDFFFSYNALNHTLCIFAC